MSSIKFRMAARCEAAGRAENEDNYQLSDNLSKENWGFTTDKEISLGKNGALVVVCDGMGGMNAGEVASALAVENIKQWFSSNELSSVVSSPSSIKKYIEKAIISADARIKEESRADSEKEGMGSTIVLAWLVDDKVYVGWCGDSRAYRYNPTDGLMQLSKDHSYVQELIDAGKLSEELAFDHPNSNIITRSLGDPNRTAKPDVKEYPLRNGDIILLCSDGLNGVLRDNEIADVIANNSGNMAECRDALWEASREAGWNDNVTIGLCQVLSGSTASTNVKGSGIRNLSSKNKKLIAGLTAVIFVLLGIIWYLVWGEEIFQKNQSQQKEEKITKDIEKRLQKYDEMSLAIILKEWKEDSTFIAENLHMGLDNFEEYQEKFNAAKTKVEEARKCDSLKKNFELLFKQNKNNDKFKRINQEILLNTISCEELEKFLNDNKPAVIPPSIDEKDTSLKQYIINFNRIKFESFELNPNGKVSFLVVDDTLCVTKMAETVNEMYRIVIAKTGYEEIKGEDILKENDKKLFRIDNTRGNCSVVKEKNTELTVTLKKKITPVTPTPVTPTPVTPTLPAE